MGQKDGQKIVRIQHIIGLCKPHNSLEKLTAKSHTVALAHNELSNLPF